VEGEIIWVVRVDGDKFVVSVDMVLWGLLGMEEIEWKASKDLEWESWAMIYVSVVVQWDFGDELGEYEYWFEKYGWNKLGESVEMVA